MEPTDADAPDDRTTTDDAPEVACRPGDQDLDARAGQVEDELAPRYRGYDDRGDGYTFRFADDGATLDALVRFVAQERACCAFAEYHVSTAPPYDEARLTVVGPDGTDDLFGWLAAWLEDAAEDVEHDDAVAEEGGVAADGGDPTDDESVSDCGC